MDFWNWFGGMVRIRFTGADVAGSLTAISRAGFSVFNSEITDELTASITIQRVVYRKIKNILISKGDNVEIVERSGLYWKMKQLFSRPVLTIGIFILLILNIYIPGRIFFIQVEGNLSVPSRKILEVVTECGLEFGTLRREIRSEKIKNKLLESIPQLQWSGVNTKGCVAVVSVRERQLTQDSPTDKAVSSIVAARDGVIIEYTVTRGNPVCKVGQAVKTGEVLISGYTDCGLKIQATNAEGEVYAKTERSLSLVFPDTWQFRTYEKAQIQKYSLIIGKKRINLYNGSGISYLSCGKMYKETYVTLPGGFVLPISIVEETWIPYVLSDIVVAANMANDTLSDYAEDYLLKQMVAGRILTSNESFTDTNGVFQIEGNYACLEMIGQVRKEEIYGQHD